MNSLTLQQSAHTATDISPSTNEHKTMWKCD